MLPNTAKEYIVNNGITANFIVFGTGTSAESTSSTKLDTETLRMPLEMSRHGNKVYFTVIFSAQMGTATYTEVGLYAGGKLTKDSGNLMSRKLDTFTKTNGIAYIYQFVFEFTGFTNIQ